MAEANPSLLKKIFFKECDRLNEICKENDDIFTWMREKHPKAYKKYVEKEKTMDDTWVKAERGEATLNEFITALRSWSNFIRKAIQKKRGKNE